jgi:cytochrome b
MSAHPPAKAAIRVWDPLVRIGHWTLVGTFAIAYFLGDEILPLHVWSGYLLGAVVVVRIIWGFVGPRHARFTDFIYAPRVVVAYLKDLLALRSRRYIGHSPAGGAMILIMIVMLAATIYSGLMVYALEKNGGPLVSLVASSTVLDNGDGDARQDRKARGHFWEEAHEIISNITLILIILHIGGVAVVSFAHRENLVRAMITGDKRPEPSP